MTCGTTLSGYICFLQEHALLPTFAISDSSKCMHHEPTQSGTSSPPGCPKSAVSSGAKNKNHDIYIYIYTRRYINTYIMWYDLIWFHMNSESIWTDDVYTCTAEKAARFNDSERMNLPPVLKCKDSSALPFVDQSGTSEAYQAHHAAIEFIKKNQHFRAFRETWSC